MKGPFDKEIALALLRGNFKWVAGRRGDDEWLLGIPQNIRQVADRFLGRGAKDREGVAALRSYLDQHYPRG
jgi:hypothetical protein